MIQIFLDDPLLFIITVLLFVYFLLAGKQQMRLDQRKQFQVEQDEILSEFEKREFESWMKIKEIK